MPFFVSFPILWSSVASDVAAGGAYDAITGRYTRACAQVIRHGGKRNSLVKLCAVLRHGSADEVGEKEGDEGSNSSTGSAPAQQPSLPAFCLPLRSLYHSRVEDG